MEDSLVLTMMFHENGSIEKEGAKPGAKTCPHHASAAADTITSFVLALRQPHKRGEIVSVCGRLLPCCLRQASFEEALSILSSSVFL